MTDAFYAVVAAISSLALKSAIGRWGYSGEGDHPIYGDFEAQRHWLEITASLKIGDWYRSGPDNDLQYWGLDYPPLTAYVSWLFGVLAKDIYPNLVELHISRGFHEPAGKVYMRSTVLLTDLLILIPAITFSLQLLLTAPKLRNSKEKESGSNNKLSSFLQLLVCLAGPASVLVDHGHFQYNGVCIGLTLLGAVAILRDRDVIGSILFCLSLNFKQMALYYSPVFFFVLLRKSYDKSTWSLRVLHLVKVGSAVIVSFAALWWPFCVYANESETCLSSLLLVLSRQFPFSRGIFEDKVANLWYSASVIVDFRKYFSIPQMAQMSLCLTILLLSPIAVELLRRKVTPTRMFLSLVNCSMAFFLASFQVHEKSLLLPLVPALLLLHHQPTLICWFQILGVFTMFPMLVRDGLRTPYFTICGLFLTLVVLYLEEKKNEKERVIEVTVSTQTAKKKGVIKRGGIFLYLNEDLVTKMLKILVGASFAGMAVLHYMEAMVPHPDRYPDLYPALFSLFGADCGHIGYRKERNPTAADSRKIE